MKTINNPVCRILGIRYPLIQAPMNWINNAEMVAAVSNAGALGVLGPNAAQKKLTGAESRPRNASALSCRAYAN